MRKVTRETVYAFLRRESLKMSNTHTDGTTLYLHDNAIARFDDKGQLWITTAGWNTVTTRERLNGLPGVSVFVRRGRLHLNDEPWNGDWVRIRRA